MRAKSGSGLSHPPAGSTTSTAPETWSGREGSLEQPQAIGRDYIREGKTHLRLLDAWGHLFAASERPRDSSVQRGHLRTLPCL